MKAHLKNLGILTSGVLLSTQMQARDREAVLADFAQLTSETPAISVQENCATNVVPAESAAEYQGAVVMFHGFTACPQQYFEWAERLSYRGWDVLLPRSPGHGQELTTDGLDQFDALPEAHGEEYLAFIDKVNALVAELPGKKVVGGLSIGGVLALKATQRIPAVYDSAIVMTPMFRLKPLQQAFFWGAGGLPFVKDQVQGWGDACENLERDNGRAGICKFRNKHIHAALHVAAKTEDTLNQTVLTQVQFIGVVGDKVIDNDRLKWVYENTPVHTQSFCLMPEGTNHSLMSRFDSPDEDKFWIDSLLSRLDQYVDAGTPFPSDAEGVCVL